MTYKLNPEIEKILSPVALVLPDGKRKEYECGKRAAGEAFSAPYQIKSMRADGGTIEIELVERGISHSTWTGEEQSIFDG